MSGYETRQKRMVYDFLRQAQGPLTMEKIVGGLTGENAPGKSSVYRIVSGLVQSGEVRRFTGETGRGFTYQLIPCHKEHLHCRCKACGQVFHLDGEVSKALCHEVLKDNGFSLDSGDTILQGKCARCRG